MQTLGCHAQHPAFPPLPSERPFRSMSNCRCLGHLASKSNSRQLLPHAKVCITSPTLQDPRPESLLFLNEVTRKIRTYLNDKRIARERQRRQGTAPSSRRWFAPAEMWVRGAVAVDTAAPEQAHAEQDEQVRTLHHARTSRRLREHFMTGPSASTQAQT